MFFISVDGSVNERPLPTIKLQREGLHTSSNTFGIIKNTDLFCEALGYWEDRIM